MEYKVVNPRKNAFVLRTFIAAFVAVIVAAAYIIFVSGWFLHGAFATDDAKTLLPNKSEEYYALSHPIHAYSDDEITAVTENNKLIIFTENGTVVKDGLTSLKQVSRLGDFLIYTDNASIYKLPVSNPSAAPVAITDSLGYPVNGTVFDTNGRYLVTVYSTNIQVYDTTTEPFVKDAEKTVSGVQIESPVAVNSDAMFYIAGG
ncbi:MAG: hypothetical protein IJU83_02795, partial [Clostridia bacterium]|nr:hypothetical protein [Clostridia bacterium]